MDSCPPAPWPGDVDEDGAEEGETRPLFGEPRDDLHAPADLAEHPVQEIGAAKAPPVLPGEEESRYPLHQALPQTPHGSRKAAAELCRQCQGPPERPPMTRALGNWREQPLPLPPGERELGGIVAHLRELAVPPVHPGNPALRLAAARCCRSGPPAPGC